MGKLYEDLASHAQIDGILFQDDAYLNDFEDFHPLALKAYEEYFGPGFKPINDDENHNAALVWSRFKGQAISDFIEPLKQAVLKYRPEARFARNIYATILTEPESAAWFSQNFDDYLKRYDEVVVMAYPEMEKQKQAERWLKELISIVNKRPEAALKTVYKLQTFDWSTNQWITSSKLLERMRTILAFGGIHLAYYPDNVFKDRPMMKFMRREMSLNGIPVFK